MSHMRVCARPTPWPTQVLRAAPQIHTKVSEATQAKLRDTVNSITGRCSPMGGARSAWIWAAAPGLAPRTQRAGPGYCSELLNRLLLQPPCLPACLPADPDLHYDVEYINGAMWGIVAEPAAAAAAAVSTPIWTCPRASHHSLPCLFLFLCVLPPTCVPMLRCVAAVRVPPACSPAS